MTLDTDDIRLLRELIAECLREAGVEQQPRKADQIKAMVRDPELAKQMFKRKKNASGDVRPLVGKYR